MISNLSNKNIILRSRYLLTDDMSVIEKLITEIESYLAGQDDSDLIEVII
jgi:hypothetical protein